MHLGNSLLLKDLLPFCFLFFLHLLCQPHSAPCCQLAHIYCPILDLISTEGISFSFLCHLPDLGPQAFCTLVYRSMNYLFGHQGHFSLTRLENAGFSLIFSMASHPKSDGFVVIMR